MPRLALFSTVALMAALSGGALAQTPPSPEQARLLESQINAWLVQVTAGTIPLPPRAIQMQPEGDHYLVTVPFAPFGQVQPPDAAFTAKARPLDSTRWALDDQRFPPDLTFNTTEMVPDAPDTKNPGPDGRHPEPVTIHAVLGEQDVHGVFDPTFSTPTTSGGTIASMDLTKTGGIGPSTSHFGRFTSQSSTQPIDPAHINMLSDMGIENYSTKADMPDGSAFSLNAARVHLMGAISGLAHDQMLPLLHTAIELGQIAKAASPGDNPGGPTPEQKAALRKLLEASHGLLTGAKLDESMEGVKFDYSGTGGSISKIALTFGGDAPQDVLSADMGLTLDGLALDFLPPNLTGFVPTHVSIHPTVSNINVAALTKMGMDATTPTPAGQSDDVPPPDLQTLFANGGINVGFDQLAMEIVGTRIDGEGKFNVTGPQSVTGQAQFTAHGLDALITKLQADPMLAQGVPVVIFLKGIAHTTADQSVWQVTVANAKVLVNGLDMSAMAGMMGK